MAKPIVTLATSADFPNLDADDLALPDALAERGIDPRIAVWNDPDVDWHNAGIVVLRSVRDYAKRRHYDAFREWARCVPRLLNHPDVVDWNSDKHYLRELEKRGVPTIPTMWLEPEQQLSKHQVHTRFPAFGDFVVKPAISSGGRGTGRYTAIDAKSRSEAINDAVHHLGRGRTVMVQRYLEEVDRKGELSLVYFNGVLSHAVEKAPMLHPSFRSTDEEEVHEEIVTAREPSEQEWLWGEKVRKAIHGLIKERSQRDILLLFNRVDVVSDGQGSFYLMEVSLIDAGLYLSSAPAALDNFADAIAQRVFW
ncbi:Glutathione synthase/Ribosomal protein S6 modification enzyme (glutaminyl transferase) [Actinomyces bovis]|uniref:Glutathione synthase/Ribosomal protein S6 modification enzyme (Glutaminyl transferase) n=1 Tax=Actinomyces bovis TaxID=1658 RepID=A0ABY1VPZ7_9ACTO|nr:glutathione synthetase [Actinomyces bovis]SPT53873.1 Glutathione synthase/Ribosomal protein S6 modification enzyme (glutaminyl transferase) [Actinomyces bovis]VEG53292.1 Glutathione synthase/Ribosomal protein S6 modification enzyme (glutaminyl transferase) [Actinomyces israelii]